MITFTKRTVFDEFDKLFKDFDDMFKTRTLYKRTLGSPHYSTTSHQINKDDGHATLRFLVPGFSKNDISVKVDGDQLLISGTTDKFESFHGWANELNLSPISIGPDLDPTKIKATVKDGILTIDIPPRTDIKNDVIDVKIQ